ncbi:MAG TPA: methyltransferase domain-containing protein [Jatrophihabitans sp.]|nr:methyltransferase domain-containing protein [Jatrophihabitans sp.]
MSGVRGSEFYQGAALAAYLERAVPDRHSPNHVMEEPAVLAEIGDPTGLRVLDLGCGDGRFGLALLAGGCAGYSGIDGSPTMVARARQILAGTEATVELGDLEELTARPEDYELITARLCLHYLAELAPVLEAMAGSLAPGGRVLLTVVHPVLTSHADDAVDPRTSWLVDDYFVPGPRERPWFGSMVTWYHRTVEQYVDAVLATGLEICAIRECEPVADRFDGDDAEFRRRLRVPAFLLISARKPPTES